MRNTLLIIVCVFARMALCTILSFDPMSGHLRIAAKDGAPVRILCAENEHPGVVRAAQDLAQDFGRVVGVNGTVIFENREASDGVVIVGTIDKSSIIDSLIEQNKLDVSEIRGQWESYVHKVIENPIDGISQAFVIAGSDKRGSIYGIYDVSETMGVSPWYYWASIPAKTKDAIFAHPSEVKIQGPPSVKYRGLFINDEWELIAWSEGKFPQSTRVETYFTHEFYSLVFELLLRLRANYLWPAMKVEVAFYADDPMNGEMADLYGVVMGTSHHEPMALSYDEQNVIQGPWDWGENSEEIAELMRNGTKRAKNWETLWTMGMRGEGDRESPTLTSHQLEQIIQRQQEMLVAETGQSLEDIPQVWSLYKEVGRYWAAGMNVSEHVTLMWADDNFGNLKRVPLSNETSRAGGHGIYYHFGYVGEPRSYNWISTIQMVKTWEQMHLAYARGARQIWIANVQDIKAHELSLEHFLAMGYDMDQFQSPQSTTEWLKQWARRDFDASENVADAVAQIINTYGQLVLRRKYETLNMRPFAFSVLYYDEALRVHREWENLADLAQRTYDEVNPSLQNAFWQLLVYPAKAGKHVFEVYIAAELGYLYKEQGRASSNARAQQAIQAFADDASEEAQYNSLFNGQWEPFVRHARMGYEGINIPGSPYGKNIMPPLAWLDDDSTSEGTGGPGVGVAIPGSNVTSVHTNEPLSIRSIDRYAAELDVAYIELFAVSNGTLAYEVEANSSFVKVSHQSGVLVSPGSLDKSDIRLLLHVDWSEAPSGVHWAALSVTSNDKVVATVLVPVNKTELPFGFRKGYVEANGVVSMNPRRWSAAEERNSATYVELPWYGKTHSGVKLWPVTVESQEPASGPKLSYDFFSFSDAENASLVIYLGASLEHDPTRPLKLAYSLDSGEPEEVRVLQDYVAGDYPPDWDTAVINGGWNITSKVDVTPGEHSLNLWILEPGIVVEKIVLDLGGMENSMLGPPESHYVG